MAEIGDVLDNRYKVVRIIGEGSVSADYKVIDTYLDRDRFWAVKEVVKIPNDEDSIFCATSLRREARLMKTFNHPRILRVLDIIENERELRVVTDFMPGQTLERVLQERGAMPSSIVAQIGIQMCEVLSYLHNKCSISYEDLRPANILMNNPGAIPNDLSTFSRLPAKEQKESLHRIETMLFDFSVASKIDYSSKTADVYAPPVNPQDDIYSLGITMLYLTTGNIPSKSEIPHSTKEYKSGRGYRVSTKLGRIILKCISENPNERYASCDDLKLDLEKCCGSLMRGCFLDRKGKTTVKRRNCFIN